MNGHDQRRFAKLISDFVDGCGFEKPLHLVVIDARGTVSVTALRSPLNRTGLLRTREGEPVQAVAVEGDVHQFGRRRQGGENRDHGGGRQATPA